MDFVAAGGIFHVSQTHIDFCFYFQLKEAIKEHVKSLVNYKYLDDTPIQKAWDALQITVRHPIISKYLHADMRIQ